jgi:tetratricopeptide (TPR) repeat protein
MGDKVMDARQMFRKAVYLLDCGQVVDAERVLRDAAAKAESEREQYTFGRALCCLGDLLFQLGRYAEARDMLTRLQGLPQEDDVLDVERLRARELLNVIRDALSNED